MNFFSHHHPQTLPDTMATTLSNRLDPVTCASKYLYDCITKNKYYFTFQARGSPAKEEDSPFKFGKPYFTEFNPACPLGRPLDHGEDPKYLLPIPQLLRANCLDKDQYPWNVLRSDFNDGWEWNRLRHVLYTQLNVAAYKAQRSTLIHPTDPQSAMSTITARAQQSSYP